MLKLVKLPSLVAKCCKMRKIWHREICEFAYKRITDAKANHFCISFYNIYSFTLDIRKIIFCFKTQQILLLLLLKARTEFELMHLFFKFLLTVPRMSCLAK